MAAQAQRFQCATCRWGRHCDERNPAPTRLWLIEGVIESDTCLLPMITPASRLLLSLHEHYRHGRLPLGGGVLEQPNAFLEAMELLTARFNQIETEMRNKHR